MAVDSLVKSWTVLRNRAGGAGPGLTWFQGRDRANEHAIGLAVRNPGVHFVVLEIVGSVQLPLPAVDVVEVN